MFSFHWIYYTGRQYDKHGNYVPSWWSKNVVEEYKKRAKCFVDEYSKFRLAGKNVSNPNYVIFKLYIPFGFQSSLQTRSQQVKVLWSGDQVVSVLLCLGSQVRSLLLS